MARTVTRNQTLEEFRGNYNKLANDVGTISGLVRGMARNPFIDTFETDSWGLAGANFDGSS